MGKKRKSKAEASQIPAEYEQPARKIIQGLQQGSRQSWERAEAQKPREDMVSGGQNCQVLVSAWNCNASMNFICKCAKDIKVFLALTMDKHKVRSQLIPN